MKHTIVKRRINAKVFVAIFLCWSIVSTCFADSGESGHYHNRHYNELNSRSFITPGAEV